MRTRSLLGVIAIVPLLLAACGDDRTTAPATVPPPDSTLPEPDRTDDGGYQHPTGADDVVLRIGFEGGFVTPEITFQDLPLVLVTGDGRLFQQGPVVAIYPGPLLPNVQVRTVSEAGIQSILGLADQYDLLAEHTYERPDMIADAADTVVTINAGGETFEHRAYALGMGGGPDDTETDERRIALADFVREIQEYAVGPESDELGPESAFEPDVFLVRTMLAGDWSGDDGIEPTVVDWPAEVSVRLDGEIECAEIPADEVAELFADANQLTWFAEDGNSYQVFVTPRLPGGGC
ncbi:hypothetical protein BH23ACT3_BH23ACT3_09760 [soil metagenome]